MLQYDSYYLYDDANWTYDGQPIPGPLRPIPVELLRRQPLFLSEDACPPAAREFWLAS